MREEESRARQINVDSALRTIRFGEIVMCEAFVVVSMSERLRFVVALTVVAVGAAFFAAAFRSSLELIL